LLERTFFVGNYSEPAVSRDLVLSKTCTGLEMYYYLFAIFCIIYTANTNCDRGAQFEKPNNEPQRFSVFRAVLIYKPKLQTMA
jgi:hypothetical protein